MLKIASVSYIGYFLFINSIKFNIYLIKQFMEDVGLDNKECENEKVVIEYGEKSLKDILNGLIEENIIEEIKKINK